MDNDMGDASVEGGPGPDGPGADEQVLLSAFERLSPQGSLDWAFTDSLRRLKEPTSGVAASAPWHGLPDDLWERGRAAKAGQRMMGDVIAELADLMDGHARDILAAGDQELRDRLVAAWDAVRYLAARLERLESRADPTRDLLVDPARLVDPPDLSPWAAPVASWFTGPASDLPVLVGESAAAVASALRAGGHRVRAVEPLGPEAWRMAGDAPSGDVVLGTLAEAAGAGTPGSLAGAVLAGATDRLDLPGQLALVGTVVDALVPSAPLVVLTTDRTAWEGRLTAAGRDLLPGHPLHPETWLALLERLGVGDLVWHRPDDGDVHAVAGRVPA